MMDSDDEYLLFFIALETHTDVDEVAQWSIEKFKKWLDFFERRNSEQNGGSTGSKPSGTSTAAKRENSFSASPFALMMPPTE